MGLDIPMNLLMLFRLFSLCDVTAIERVPLFLLEFALRILSLYTFFGPLNSDKAGVHQQRTDQCHIPEVLLS